LAQIDKGLRRNRHARSRQDGSYENGFSHRKSVAPRQEIPARHGQDDPACGRPKRGRDGTPHHGEVCFNTRDEHQHHNAEVGQDLENGRNRRRIWPGRLREPRYGPDIQNRGTQHHACQQLSQDERQTNPKP